jgi:hypothetical protein
MGGTTSAEFFAANTDSDMSGAMACRMTLIVRPKTARRWTIPDLLYRMNTKPFYSFQVSGIPAYVIDELRQLPDDELTKRRAIRIVADKKPGFPCRVSLQDAEVGETVFLFNFEHLAGDSPYRSVGPIFVRESAVETYSRTNELPEVLRVPGRLFSVRAYDERDMLVAAEVVDTAEIDQAIQRLFSDEKIIYLHVHNARPGCYSCRIDRA